MALPQLLGNAGREQLPTYAGNWAGLSGVKNVIEIASFDRFNLSRGFAQVIQAGR
jgi:hypothetical protein